MSMTLEHVCKPWRHFAGGVSEYTSSSVRKMFEESGVEVEDDDMLEFALQNPELISITHLDSGITVGITSPESGQHTLASGRRVW